MRDDNWRSGLLEKARGTYLRREVADDDILDAIAALWTATRIITGKSETLPTNPPADAMGLRVETVF
jgi:predicted RNase H-like nuclease